MSSVRIRRSAAHNRWLPLIGLTGPSSWRSNLEPVAYCVGWVVRSAGRGRGRSGGDLRPAGGLGRGSFESWAHGVSADGAVVVGFGMTASAQEAFRWTSEDGMVGLGDLPNGFNRSVAYSVSADGSVVVGRGNVYKALEGIARRRLLSVRLRQRGVHLGRGQRDTSPGQRSRR